jgi:hypothetical protein
MIPVEVNLFRAAEGQHLLNILTAVLVTVTNYQKSSYGMLYFGRGETAPGVHCGGSTMRSRLTNQSLEKDSSLVLYGVP